jgi:predicted metal-dependent hydrolase
MNHSKLFWEEVEKLYPDYKQAGIWMKKYGLSLQ